MTAMSLFHTVNIHSPNQDSKQRVKSKRFHLICTLAVLDLQAQLARSITTQTHHNTLNSTILYLLCVSLILHQYDESASMDVEGYAADHIYLLAAGEIIASRAC
jgi:hypothetical protein